jgi:hypothetical protein
MGAERSTEATRVTAATAVSPRVVECGELAGIYARGLVVRGYAAEDLGGGKIKTTAPDSVYEAMDTGYRTRGGSKKK